MAKLSLAGITTFTPPCNPSSSFSLSADARARASSTNWTVEEPPLTISRTACSDVVLLCLVRWLACSLPTLGLGTGASVMGYASGREISRCSCLYMLVSSTCMCICCYAHVHASNQTWPPVFMRRRDWGSCRSDRLARLVWRSRSTGVSGDIGAFG